MGFHIWNEELGQVEERDTCDRCECTSDPVVPCYHGCWPEYHNAHQYLKKYAWTMDAAPAIDNRSFDSSSENTPSDHAHAALPHPISETRGVSNE